MPESTTEPAPRDGVRRPSDREPAPTTDLEWLSLDETESVLWAGGPDRRTILPAASLLVLPVLALAGVSIEPVVGLLAAAGLSLVVAPIVGLTVLHVRTTDYVVTTSGLYEKRGVLSRDVTRIDFEKVQNTAYNQSAVGRRLGYGTVDVSSAGGSGVEMQFRSIPNPREIQQLISSRVTPGRSDSSTNGTEAVLEEILTELRAIRRTLEDGADGRARDQPSESELSTAERVSLESDAADTPDRK